MANLIERFSLMSVLTSLVGCGITGPAHDEPLPDVAAVVDMGFTSFEPDVVRIHAGQTVEWRNTAFITHSVSSDSTKAKSPNDASIPEGARPLNSGDLLGGDIYLQTFMVPGTYKYFCTHYEDDGMVGTVIVDPAREPY
jgi:plastocyanin